MRYAIEKPQKIPLILIGIATLSFFVAAVILWNNSTEFTLDSIDWEPDPVVIAICGMISVACFPLSMTGKRKKLEVLDKLANHYGNLEENIMKKI